MIVSRGVEVPSKGTVTSSVLQPLKPHRPLNLWLPFRSTFEEPGIPNSLLEHAHSMHSHWRLDSRPKDPLRPAGRRRPWPFPRASTGCSARAQPPGRRRADPRARAPGATTSTAGRRRAASGAARSGRAVASPRTSTLSGYAIQPRSTLMYSSVRKGLARDRGGVGALAHFVRHAHGHVVDVPRHVRARPEDVGHGRVLPFFRGGVGGERVDEELSDGQSVVGRNDKGLVPCGLEFGSIGGNVERLRFTGACHARHFEALVVV